MTEKGFLESLKDATPFNCNRCGNCVKEGAVGPISDNAAATWNGDCNQPYCSRFDSFLEGEITPLRLEICYKKEKELRGITGQQDMKYVLKKRKKLPQDLDLHCATNPEYQYDYEFLFWRNRETGETIEGAGKFKRGWKSYKTCMTTLKEEAEVLEMYDKGFDPVFVLELH